MKRILSIMVALLVIGACDPDIVPLPDDPQPEQPVPTPDPDPDPEPEPEPEPEPNNPLSTLKGDIEVVFSADSSLAYADCFGDYYSTGLYMWGFYFMEFTAKVQLYIEVMCQSNELEIPTGVFSATDDKACDGALLIGCVEEDVDGLYNAYSWYTQLATESQEAATAPIVDGVMNISYDEASDTYSVTLDLKDDADNSITARYEHRIILEDFRI